MAASPKQKPRSRKGTVPARKKQPRRAADDKRPASRPSRTGGRNATPPPRKAARPRKPADSPRSAPALAEVDAEVLEFIAALDRFKQEHGRPFPSWSEVLLVLRQLGYRRQ